MASNVVKWGLAGVLVLGAAIGGELLYLHHRNVLDQTEPATTRQTYSADPDALVFLKRQHPMSLKDEKDLRGQPLWVAAGNQMVYYPYPGHIDFAHPVGVLAPIQKIIAKDAVEEKAKADRLNIRLPLGDKQVFLVFTEPDDATKQYATPVGFEQAGDHTFSTDDIYYYDDPHQLFNFWKPEQWKAIDEHRVIPGMSEHQTQVALGQVMTFSPDSTAGDRTVTFDNLQHPVDVTFVHDKATKIVAEKP